jgi:hypothetical protein
MKIMEETEKKPNNGEMIKKIKRQGALLRNAGPIIKNSSIW